MRANGGTQMSVQRISEIAASIAVILSVVWLVLGISGIKTLRDIREALQKGGTKGASAQPTILQCDCDVMRF
jgi:hypothetical protein